MQRLDGWLDAQMSEDEAREFETLLGQETELRAAADLSRAIDASLRRSFAPAIDESLKRSFSEAVLGAPAQPEERVEAIAGRIHRNGTVSHRGKRMEAMQPAADAHEVQPQRGRRAARWFAAAAAIVGLAVAAWQIAPYVWPRSQYQTAPWTAMTDVYHETVAAGFEPEWVCDDDAEFTRMLRDQYGQGLVLRGLDEVGIRTLGMRYSNTLSSNTTCVLFIVDDEPVMTLIDRIERDQSQAIPQGCGLHVHRREVGRLVVYEVTPLGESRVLQHYDVAAAGESPPG